MSDYHLEDLYSLLFNTEDIEHRVARFLVSTNHELALRQHGQRSSCSRSDGSAAGLPAKTSAASDDGPPTFDGGPTAG